MKNIIESTSFPISGRGMYEITIQLKKWVNSKNLKNGHLNLFIQHTSASLTIMENASPDVLNDINSFF